ncbi:hypothetical protein OS493_028138, partial [Desmophyllum pertusum]
LKKEFRHCAMSSVDSLETWEILAIRAAVGMYLVSKYISKETDTCTVVMYYGEDSDELCLDTSISTRLQARTKQMQSHLDCWTILYLYDVLRANRSTAAHGLQIASTFLGCSLYTLFPDTLSRNPST